MVENTATIPSSTPTNTPEVPAQSVMMSAPTSVAKYPDPSDPPDVPIIEDPSIAAEEKKSQKKFTLKLILVLLLIPLIAGGLAVGYQLYRQVSVTQNIKELTPDTVKIDPNDVVFEEVEAPVILEAEATAQATVNPEWQLFADPQGVSFHYPSDQIVVESEAADANTTSSRISATFLSDAAEENPSSMIDITISASEVGQTATQSATRDFSTQEFKVYEYPSSTVWVGQLPSGQWMQVRMKFTSQVQRREVMEEIINGIELFAPSQI